MDFTLASPQHRSSLTPDSQPVEQLLECKEMLLAVERNQQQHHQQQQQQQMLFRSDSYDPEEQDEDDEDCPTTDGGGGGGGGSDSSDGSSSRRSSTTLGNLHSLPLHELKERRREAKDHKKKLRRSLRQFEERYEREHGHKLAKEDRGVMEQTYLDYKHAKAKLRLLEALISKKAPKEDEF